MSRILLPSGIVIASGPPTSPRTNATFGTAPPKYGQIYQTRLQIFQSQVTCPTVSTQSFGVRCIMVHSSSESSELLAIHEGYR